jgi:hypothetical protein
LAGSRAGSISSIMNPNAGLSSPTRRAGHNPRHDAVI